MIDVTHETRVEALGNANWTDVSKNYLHGRRSDLQCANRWELNTGLKKGPWTDEEDRFESASLKIRQKIVI